MRVGRSEPSRLANAIQPSSGRTAVRIAVSDRRVPSGRCETAGRRAAMVGRPAPPASPIAAIVQGSGARSRAEAGRGGAIGRDPAPAASPLPRPGAVGGRATCACVRWCPRPAARPLRAPPRGSRAGPHRRERRRRPARMQARGRSPAGPAMDLRSGEDRREIREALRLAREQGHEQQAQAAEERDPGRGADQIRRPNGRLGSPAEQQGSPSASVRIRAAHALPPEIEAPCINGPIIGSSSARARRSAAGIVKRVRSRTLSVCREDRLIFRKMSGSSGCPVADRIARSGHADRRGG
ncbi:hypothetical protein AU375_00238 [Methylobacterium radiotolerans]|nr:hypothetical protein AU375_00238 [Methylobacterium radiotolerans]